MICSPFPCEFINMIFVLCPYLWMTGMKRIPNTIPPLSLALKSTSAGLSLTRVTSAGTFPCNSGTGKVHLHPSFLKQSELKNKATITTFQAPLCRPCGTKEHSKPSFIFFFCFLRLRLVYFLVGVSMGELWLEIALFSIVAGYSA